MTSSPYTTTEATSKAAATTSIADVPATNAAVAADTAFAEMGTTDSLSTTGKHSSIPADLQVIDIHCHIYPAKIATRAVAAVSDFYSIKMDVPDGTAAGLRTATANSPIGRCVIHSVATRADQVASINDFIASECRLSQHVNAESPTCPAATAESQAPMSGTTSSACPAAATSSLQMTGFMTLHQDLADPEAEIERAMGLGLRGIKLHPDTQRVNMDDPRLMRIYEIAQAKRLPLMIHCGDYRYDYSHPRRMLNVLRTFPDLVVDAAHFGGWSIFDLAVEYLERERCFMDMSSSIALLGLRRVRELVRMYGAERIMFGSDFPMWSPTRELELFVSAGFTEAELRAMLHDNALRFLGEAGL